MEFRGLKINVIVLVIGIVLIAFFAGRHILNVYNVEKPLKEELTQLTGIDRVELVNRNDKTDISVSFQQGVDFYQVYHNLNQIVTQKLGDKKGEIKINNQNNPDLTEAYYQLHYAIYEGMATKEFVRMQQRVDEIARGLQLDDYRLRIDNEAIYLQMNLNGKSAFYRIPYNNYIAVNLNGGDSNG